MLKAFLTVVATLATVISVYAAEEGLVGYWPLNAVDGNVVKDVGPNHLDGVIVEPKEIRWVDGRNGKAIEFRGINGSASYIRIDKIKEFDFSKGMTVMCWYNPAADQERGHQGVIVCNAPTGVSEGFRFLLHYRRILLGDGKLSNYAATNPGVHPLQAGIWVHIAATYDGDKTFQIFMDGQLAGTNAEGSSGLLVPGIDSLAIGSEFGYRPALATISDVKLYTRKLSIPEILAAAREE